MNNIEKDAIKAKMAFDLMEGALKSIGQLGEVIENIINKNWIGMLISLIARLASSFSNISENAAAAQNILDVVFDIIENIIDDLGESLNSIFKPLLDIISALSVVIGSVLRLVINLITPLANLINNFNFLTPILNAVAVVVAGLTDALGHLFNFVFDIIKKITFGLVDLGRMQTNNLEKVLDSINQENSYSDYQNNSSSYDVAGNLEINIYFQNSYVNGDSRQIALAIRDEIRLAENQGY
jgi:phage-related protein